MKTLSNNLKKLRLHFDFSQSQVSNAIGVKVSVYQHWENRNVEPPLCKLILLADLYNISVDELLKTNPKPKAFTLDNKFAVAPEHIKKAIYTLLEL